MSVAISAEGLSKQYRIGQFRPAYGTLRDSVVKSIRRIKSGISNGFCPSGNREINQGLIFVGESTLDDSNSLPNPFIIGVNKFGEIVVGNDPVSLRATKTKQSGRRMAGRCGQGGRATAHARAPFRLEDSVSTTPSMSDGDLMATTLSILPLR